MKSTNNLLKYTAITIIAAAFVLSSCDSEFLEPTVSTAKDLETNVNNVDDLNNIVLGAYERLSQTGFLGRDIIAHGSVRSDDGFSNGNSGRFVASAQFEYQSTSGDPNAIWNDGYEVIANTNIVLNAVTEDDGTPEADHIKGEAYAIRALAHMQLLLFFGQQNTGGTLGVPYITEYLGDLAPARLSVTEGWTKIGEDLNMASSLMSESLNDGPIRFTTYGVAALKTRYYLFIQDYANVISNAQYVINSGLFQLANASNLATSYVGSSPATSIFELAFTLSDNLGINGLYQIMNYTGYGDVLPLPGLYNLYDAGDARRNLIEYDATLDTYRMVGKYPTSTYDDNVRVIRYAEVILNYAEALFMSGQTGPALTQLNSVPAAVGAQQWASVTLGNILDERRKELAMEGFRFHDLMRHGMDILKTDPSRQTFTGNSVPFGDPRLALPIPEAEINANSNIVQNTGY